jgi:hypothetical protein
MMWTLGGSVIFAIGVVMLWCWLFARWNQRRARHLLSRIESAFEGNAQVKSVQWRTASEFEVQVDLENCAFVQPAITVRMLPREMPLSWIISRLKKQRETLTFQADLHCPPGFNLVVQNQRWFDRSRRRINEKKAVLRLKHIGPFVMSSRSDWHRDITNMMHALSASRDCDLLSVSFQRTSPHFSATIPLGAIDRAGCSPVRIFEALRELASGASTAKF